MTIAFIEGTSTRFNLSAPTPWRRFSSFSVPVIAFIAAFLMRVCRCESEKSVYRYNICNGLSNQLLYHAASIAIASEQKKLVEIPNHFIVNGVQSSNIDVLPTSKNSIPLEVAFDIDYLLDELHKLDIQAKLVTFDFTRTPIPCAGMQSLQNADPKLVKDILSAMRPGERVQKIIDSTLNFLDGENLDNGICVHHRDGQDWFDHCRRWSSIHDGIYRGNCLGVPGRTFVNSLEDRGLTPGKWIYYCGDHDVPHELTSNNMYKAWSGKDLQDTSGFKDLTTYFPDLDSARDLAALVDFFVCNDIPHFIGNSVSTFSAVQIAMRQSENSFWYNSQSIPLGDIWKYYRVPIVYTYTELSHSGGKHLLQTSILSVKKQMPATKIHIIYHGREDKIFRKWLVQQGVQIHQHDPIWRNQIETMRKNGNPASSHLFLHSGNYFGTWQRIDIPLFINSEYCLLLDADTIVLRPFTYADFGLDLTPAISMSSEFNPDNQAVNAGVMLLNIPYLRQTHHDFMEFILQHVSSALFKNNAPSDQGAYQEFYQRYNRFMPLIFNFKPYWKLSVINDDNPAILHFHGAKPHDYLKHIMGDECDGAINFLCHKALSSPFLCESLHHFATLSESIDTPSYCQASFHHIGKARYCSEIFHALAETNLMCFDFPLLLDIALNRVPDGLGLEKDKIRLYLRSATRQFPFVRVAIITISILCIIFRLRNRRKNHRKRNHHAF